MGDGEIGDISVALNAFRERLMGFLDQVTQMIRSPNFDAVEFANFHSGLVLSHLLSDDDSTQAARANDLRAASVALMKDMVGPQTRALGQIVIDKIGITIYNSCHAATWVINHILMLSRGLDFNPDMFVRGVVVGEAMVNFGGAVASWGETSAMGLRMASAMGDEMALNWAMGDQMASIGVETSAMEEEPTPLIRVETSAMEGQMSEF
jgi:hypothetical protein